MTQLWRRLTVGLASFALLAAPLAIEAQPAAKVYRIGYLGITTKGREIGPQQCPVKGGSTWRAWLEGMRERGYVPGRNLVIECRWTEDRPERAPALAAELVNLKVDLLVAAGTPQVRAAKEATTEIPILMVGVLDPVRSGLVVDLARPGGNVTGLADNEMEVEAKRLQLLKEIAPKLSRVAVLHYSGGNPEMPASTFQAEEEAAARALGLTLQFHGVQAPAEIPAAFAAMTTAQAEALFVRDNGFWDGHEERIAELAAKSRLPAAYPGKAFAEAGGLASYAANERAARRRLGEYVDKIFRGAKPGDLPVLLPTRFELLVNLKAAKALGLTIPPSVLTRADEVIQ
jgi:putative ABC transport system substrate-binding protein